MMTFDKPDDDSALALPKEVALWAFGDDNPLDLTPAQARSMAGLGGYTNLNSKQMDKLKAKIREYWRDRK